MKWMIVDDKNIADLYIKVFGQDKINLFKNIVEAFSDQITNINQLKTNLKEKIIIKEDDLENLIREFINQLIYLKDVKKELFKKGEFFLEKKILQATLFGQKITDKLPLKVDIKALTYHKFKIEKRKNGYQVHLIFDI